MPDMIKEIFKSVLTVLVMSIFCIAFLIVLSWLFLFLKGLWT